MADNHQNAKDILQAGLDAIKSRVDGRFDDLGNKIAEVQKRLGDVDTDASLNLSEIAAMARDLQVKVEQMEKHQRDSMNMGLDTQDKEVKNFSFSRFARMAYLASRNGNRVDDNVLNESGAGHEYEMHKAYQARLKDVGGVVGIGVDSGFWVPQIVVDDIIPAIYAQTVLLQNAVASAAPSDGPSRVAIMRPSEGLGEIKISRFDGGSQSFWSGETDAPGESFANVGLETIQRRKLLVLTRMSEEMREGDALGFESMLRQDMVMKAALRLDAAAFYGAGTSDQPIGIANLPYEGSDPEVVKLFLASTGAQATSAPAAAALTGGELDFLGLERAVGLLEDDNIQPQTSRGFTVVSTPKYFRRLAEERVQQFSGASIGGSDYRLGVPTRVLFHDEQMLREAVGLDIARTTQIASNQVPGASRKMATTVTDTKFGDVFIGDFSQMVFAMWGGINLMTDNGQGTYFAEGETRLRWRLFCGWGCRRRRAFVHVPDVRMAD